jgi:hypothetical protein
MVNPPSAYKQLSSNSSLAARNRRAEPKTFVYTRVANFGDFFPKKQILGILLKNVPDIFQTNICTFKGIVSPDWTGLQMISLDRFEV